MTSNPFREMAGAMRARSGFDGNLLLFKKGFWTAGKDAVDMNDKQLTALVDDTMFGWTKWEDKRPVDYAIGRVADGFKPPKRSQLGDHDRSLWSFDKEPWQLGFYPAAFRQCRKAVCLFDQLTRRQRRDCQSARRL